VETSRSPAIFGRNAARVQLLPEKMPQINSKQALCGNKEICRLDKKTRLATTIVKLIPGVGAAQHGFCITCRNKKGVPSRMTDGIKIGATQQQVNVKIHIVP
jgi:hypothetical protein